MNTPAEHLEELAALREKEKTRRMVACWRALDGVPTEWLENYVAGGAENILQENARLQAENSRLREDAEELLKQIELYSECKFGWPGIRDAAEALRSTLEKTK